MSKIEIIKSLYDQWNEAVKSGDVKQISALYDAEFGVLLPTASNQVRHNRAEIEDYFKTFAAKKPAGKIDESNVRLFDGLAINSGLYTFAFGDGSDGGQARFTFVYRKVKDKWLIVEHHSSWMPE